MTFRLPKAALALASLVVLAFPLAVGAVGVDPAISSMTTDQLVQARQKAMQEDESILRKAKKLVDEDAVAAATELLQNFTNFPALFKEGAVNAKSHAKPEIWQDFARFKAMFAADAKLAQQMLTAADDADDDSYFAAIDGIAESCDTCHRAFRRPGL